MISRFPQLFPSSLKKPVVFISVPPRSGDDDPTVEKESVANQVKKAVAEILGAKGNDPMAALDTLIRKNHRLEERAETAETKVADLQKQVPDEKTIAEIAKWRELGETPDKVKAQLENGIAASQKATKYERDEALKESGFDPEKFNALKGVDDLVFGSRDESQDGKTVKVRTVKQTVDGKEVEKSVSQFVTETFPSLAESLKLAQSNKREAPPSEANRGGGSDAVIGDDEMKLVAQQMGLPVPK